MLSPTAFSTVEEESRYSPLQPSLIPTFAPAVDKRRFAARLSWQPRHGCITSFPLVSYDHNIRLSPTKQARATPRCATERSPLPDSTPSNCPIFRHNTLVQQHSHPSAATINRILRQSYYEPFDSAAPNAHCLRYDRSCNTRRFNIGSFSCDNN